MFRFCSVYEGKRFEGPFMPGVVKLKLEDYGDSKKMGYLKCKLEGVKIQAKEVDISIVKNWYFIIFFLDHHVINVQFEMSLKRRHVVYKPHFTSKGTRGLYK